jgi:sorbitol-specific phosphotransferase system component IIC
VVGRVVIVIVSGCGAALLFVVWVGAAIGIGCVGLTLKFVKLSFSVISLIQEMKGTVTGIFLFLIPN